jgi:hypothetical protein
MTRISSGQALKCKKQFLILTKRILFNQFAIMSTHPRRKRKEAGRTGFLAFSKQIVPEHGLSASQSTGF